MGRNVIERWICDRCRKVHEQEEADATAPSGWRIWLHNLPGGAPYQRGAHASSAYLLCSQCDDAVYDFVITGPTEEEGT